MPHTHIHIPKFAQGQFLYHESWHTASHWTCALLHILLLRFKKGLRSMSNLQKPQVENPKDMKRREERSGGDRRGEEKEKRKRREREEKE